MFVKVSAGAESPLGDKARRGPPEYALRAAPQLARILCRALARQPPPPGLREQVVELRADAARYDLQAAALRLALGAAQDLMHDLPDGVTLEFTGPIRFPTSVEPPEAIYSVLGMRIAEPERRSA